MAIPKITLCYDYKVFEEYREVLFRPKFSFSKSYTNWFLNEIQANGFCVNVAPSDFQMTDESDRKFYDLAKYCDAYLITGNKKHCLSDSIVVSPDEFLRNFAME